MFRGTLAWEHLMHKLVYHPRWMRPASWAQAIDWSLGNVAVMAAERVVAVDTTKTTRRAEWIGFADIPLSGEDKANFKGQEFVFETFEHDLEDFLAEGYKISMSYQAKQGSFVAAATATRVGMPNAGLTMSAWHRTPLDAVRLVLFKHYHVAHGDWQGERENEDFQFG